MEGYLGDFPIDVPTSPFADFTSADWAMYFVERFGQGEAAEHKAWVLDQVARILKGTPVCVVEARWDNGETEFRVSTVDDPSEDYKAWVDGMRQYDVHGEPQYEYSFGAPN